MPEIPIDPFVDDDPLLAQHCHSQQQYWITLIIRNESEIGQLLRLLTDLPNEKNGPTLKHQAILYYSDLKRIESSCRRLRHDLFCTHSSCPITDRTPCCKPPAGLYTSLAMANQLHTLTDELKQIKAACRQLL